LETSSAGGRVRKGRSVDKRRHLRDVPGVASIRESIAMALGALPLTIT
jgi:hypothetical protein